MRSFEEGGKLLGSINYRSFLENCQLLNNSGTWSYSVKQSGSSINEHESVVEHNSFWNYRNVIEPLY
jgi:hypothetical protein